MKKAAILSFSLLIISLLHGQQFRCDWGVVGIGGTTMANSGYWCGSTVGQTVVGITSSASNLIYAGFWYPEILAGVNENNHFFDTNSMENGAKIYPISLSYSKVWIRYLLGGEERVYLVVYDVSGRVIRTLVNSYEKSGMHSVNWDATDDHGEEVGSGVYFLKFSAGRYSKTVKVLLMK
jgi:hypothetical protein